MPRRPWLRRQVEPASDREYARSRREPCVTSSIQLQKKDSMTILRRLSGVITQQSALTILLSVAATYVCVLEGWSGDIPQPLVATAVIFPIAFSINAAYSRRAEALACQSSIASNAAMLFFAHRDWGPGGGEMHAHRIRDIIVRLLEAIRANLSAGRSVSAGIEKDPGVERIYGVFSECSRSIELLRAAKLAPTEVSNLNQCLRSIIQDVERLRRIVRYPTPSALRTYTKTFLYGLPILMGPYFAFLAVKHGIGVGFFVAVMYSLILVSLDRVQEQLENPFDGVGADDVHLNAADFCALVLSPTPFDRAA
jgi:predicted membrane chloride channel (bestrophin family)